MVIGSSMRVNEMRDTVQPILAMALTVSLLAHPALAAASRTYPWTIVENWSIRQTSENRCNASFSYSGGSRLILSTKTNEDLLVTIANPRWDNLRDFSGTMNLSLVFLGQSDGVFTTVARKAPDQDAGLEARISAGDTGRFMTLWSTTSNLRISQGDVALESLSLSGSAAAMAAMGINSILIKALSSSMGMVLRI